MKAHFPFRLAMVCANCESVFTLQSVCPACTSGAIYPVEKFLMSAAAEVVRLHARKSA